MALKVTKSKTWFSRFSKWISRWTGSPLAFGLALGTIVTWAVTGPLFGFSDTWQLVINTGTTIVTFLMVFLIQNTQNRDGTAVQVKLDELIRCTSGAHNALLDLEELEEKELREITREYEEIADRARAALHKGKSDTGTPAVRGRKPHRKP
jgi:low affinity Fe/Cu permease